MANEEKWKWENDPEVIRKKCYHCGKSMMLEREHAVSYEGYPYHLSCLLTKLTKYHTEHSSTPAYLGY